MRVTRSVVKGVVWEVIGVLSFVLYTGDWALSLMWAAYRTVSFPVYEYCFKFVARWWSERQARIFFEKNLQLPAPHIPTTNLPPESAIPAMRAKLARDMYDNLTPHPEFSKELERDCDCDNEDCKALRNETAKENTSVESDCYCHRLVCTVCSFCLEVMSKESSPKPNEN